MVAGEDLDQFAGVVDRLLSAARSAGYVRGDGEPYAIPDIMVTPAWRWDFRGELSSPGHLHPSVGFLVWVSEPAGLRGYNIDLKACAGPGTPPPEV